MKVACITYFTPRQENVRGPTGLLYQTLRLRPANVDVTIFIVNRRSEDIQSIPEVRELSEAGAKFVHCSQENTFARKQHWPLGAREIGNTVIPDLSGFDVVWAYPYWFAPFLKAVGKPALISGMDCATLLYWRKLSSRRDFASAAWWRCAAGLLSNLLFEARYLRGQNVHVVGKTDAKILNMLGARATYIPHPFLAYQPAEATQRAADPQLTILLSNAGDAIYGSSRYLEWVRALARYAGTIGEVSLLLHKASSEAIDKILQVAASGSGLKVRCLSWVADYSELLSGVDIQLFPLDVGAGTKTSVLTALQHGVLAVCTPVAAENVQPNRSLWVVHDKLDFARALEAAATVSQSDHKRLSPLTELTDHSPATCVDQFWTHLAHCT